MNYWKELFFEKDMEIDHVIATTMSIDICEIIKILAISKYYQCEDANDKDIRITDLMIDAMFMGNEKSWYSKFSFFYDYKNGEIQNQCQNYLSATVVNKMLSENIYPVNIDTIFHPKIILVKFKGNDCSLWKAMVSSHNLTISEPYEGTVVLRGVTSNSCNHMFVELFSFLNENTNVNIEDYIKELKNVNFILCQDSVNIEVCDISISGIDCNKLTPFSHIYESLKDKPGLWRVVSPVYETGSSFQGIGLVYAPCDKNKQLVNSHAKIYFKLNDKIKLEEMWIGSSNCSDRGLGGNNTKPNVECLVHLKIKNEDEQNIFMLKNDGFNFAGTEFIKAKDFTKVNYLNINDTIMSFFNLVMINSEYNGKQKVTVKLNHINKLPHIENSKVFILPVGYHETNTYGNYNWKDITDKIINGRNIEVTFNGNSQTVESYALRIVIEKGYVKRERIWIASNISEFSKEKDPFAKDILNKIITFTAYEYLDNIVRQREFSLLWKSATKAYIYDPDKLNLLDQVLRNYLDDMRLMKQCINPCDFIWKSIEINTEYQHNAIKQAYERLKMGGRYLIADEAGLGKTYIAQGIINKLRDEMKEKGKDKIRIIYFVSNLYLLDKTAEKLCRGMQSWKYVKKNSNYDIDRVSMIPLNDESEFDVLLYMVSGNIYGKFAKSECGSENERKYLELKKDEKLEDKRKDVINCLVKNNSIDLVICDEFHRYPDAVKQISNDFNNNIESIPILYMSATPYNWYNSQVYLNEGVEVINTKEADSGLNNFQDVLNMLNIDDDTKKLYNDFDNYADLVMKLKQYIWRNERVYGGDERRICIPTKKEYLSNNYTLSVINRLRAESNQQSLFGQLFPGQYSFMCKGKKKQDKNYYICLEEFKNLSDNNFIFDNENRLIESMIDYNYKLYCIKNIQVDNQLQMLWITPVHSKYLPEKPFIKNATKLLIFSGYKIVPRGVSTIFSKYVQQKNSNSEFTDIDIIINELKKYDELYGSEIYNRCSIPNEGTFSKIKELPYGLDLINYLSKVSEFTENYEFEGVNQINVSFYVVGSPYITFRKMGAKHDKAIEYTYKFYNIITKGDKKDILNNYIENCKYGNSKLEKLLFYFCSGCLDDMLNEYYHVSNCKDFGEFSKNLDKLECFDGVSVTALNSNTFFNWKSGIEISPFSCLYAVPFTPDENDSGGQVTSKSGQEFQKKVQESFNSPFWPMIITTTSAGQEGIDMDAYCRRIMHYTVPYSPMSFEQRDGRIDRRKSLAAREKINILWGKYLQEYCPNDTSKESFWNNIFYFGCDSSGLSPMWSLREPVTELGLERIIPFIPGTREYDAYNRLVDIKHEYRKAFGMPDELGIHFNKFEGLKLHSINNKK